MIFGGNKFLRRIISLVLSAAMVISMSAVLSSCGGKRRITVWVYSEEYRKSEGIELLKRANIKVENFKDDEI